MQPKQITTTQINDAQNDVALRFAQAVSSRNYALVTQLIENGSIDPNEVIDARKRIYPQYKDTQTPRFMTVWKVLASVMDNEIWWNFPEYVYEKTDEIEPTLQTILHEAIARRNEYLIDALLSSNKINPNQKSAQGYTPLHYAVLVNSPNIVKKLIEKGADPTLTCNGFTPAELTRSKQIKALLPASIMDRILSMLPTYLKQYLPGKLHPTQSELIAPGNGQFGILSKMRAMREGDEVIYANDIGVCSGVAHIAMFFLLSNRRDEQGIIIGQKKLEYILQQIVTLSTESFLEKITFREQERLQAYETARANVDGMTEFEITNQLETLNTSGNIDTNAFIKAHLSAEKKTLLLQKKFEQEMASCFSKQALIELGFREFLDGVELLQDIKLHPELHKKQLPILRQVPAAAFSLLMPAELEMLGGLSKPIHACGVFLQKNGVNKNELEIYFQCLQDKFERLEFPIAIQLGANSHGISVFYDPAKKNWRLVDANQKSTIKPIVTTDSSIKIAKLVYDALKFGHAGMPGPDAPKPYLILMTQIYTANQYEVQLTEQMALFDHHPEFQTLFDVTPFKTTLTDKDGFTWREFAVNYGLVHTVQMLHEKHGYDDLDPDLDIYYAEYMKKLWEQYENYYQEQNNEENYAIRYALLEFAAALKYTIIETDAIQVKENKRLQFKFLIEVLKQAPIAENAGDDGKMITQAILACYSRWCYQGRDVSVLFSSTDAKNPINKFISKHSNYIDNLNSIAQQDSDLSIKIRQAIHKLEKAPVDEDSIAFLSNCLIVAGEMASENALNNICGGVLEQAIECVHKQSQNTGKVLSENIHNVLSTMTYFKEKIQTLKTDEADASSRQLNKGLGKTD